MDQPLAVQCSQCGRVVVLPANFCDLCGLELTKPTESASSLTYFKKLHINPQYLQSFLKSANKDLIIRTGIPLLVMASGLFLYLSKSRNLNHLFLFLLPAMIGTIVGAVNLKNVTRAIEKTNEWTLQKLESVKDRGKKRHKYYFTPWYWMLFQINTLTDKIKIPEVRNGFKVAAFFYICFLMIFVAYVAVAIVVGIILLAIVFWIIAFATGDEAPTYKVKAIKKRIEPKPKTRTCSSCTHYWNKDYSINKECKLGYETKGFGNTPACEDYDEGMRVFGPANYCSNCSAYDTSVLARNKCTKGNLLPKSGHACEGYIKKEEN